jgi:nicotinamidase-related amidase
MVSGICFRPHKDNLAFVVIDFQEKLLEAMERDTCRRVTRNIQLLVRLARLLKIPLIVTEQYPRGLGSTSKGLKEILGDLYQPVEKLSFSCYRQPAFLEKVKSVGVKHFVLAGLEMHVCVLQTVLDLLADSYEVSIVSDAVCSRYKSDWQVGLRIAGQAGAVISSTETIIFQLLEQAGTAEFKNMSPLLKQRQ